MAYIKITAPKIKPIPIGKRKGKSNRLFIKKNTKYKKLNNQSEGKGK